MLDGTRVGNGIGACMGASVHYEYIYGASDMFDELARRRQVHTYHRLMVCFLLILYVLGRLDLSARSFAISQPIFPKRASLQSLIAY